MVKEVTDNKFEQEVLNSDKPVLVDFWAEWCGPCKMLAPILDELHKDIGEKVVISKMNIDENPDTPTKYGVRGIPTMMLFVGGKHVSTKVGALPKAALKDWIESETQ